MDQPLCGLLRGAREGHRGCLPTVYIKHLSLHGQVDQPLCVECAARVCEETEAACAEAEAECATYKAALARLAAEDARPLPPEVRCAIRYRIRDMAQTLALLQGLHGSLACTTVLVSSAPGFSSCKNMLNLDPHRVPVTMLCACAGV